MTEYSADDIRKAADVMDHVSKAYGESDVHQFDLREYAERLDRASAAKARHDEQVEELARTLHAAFNGVDHWAKSSMKDYWTRAARAILADGRWVRVEDGA